MTDERSEDRIRSSQRMKNILTKLSLLRALVADEARKARPVAEAAYRVRFVRIAGIDVYGDLPAACDLLVNGGMLHSARFVAGLIAGRTYESTHDDAESARKFLAEHPEEAEAPVDERIVIDNRSPGRYALACVVSVFKEGNRALECLERLADQSLYRDGKLEIIFVDSASPAGEEALFLASKAALPHFAYVKTSRTEKLPAAWNRGARLATSELLTFTAPSNLFTANAFELLLQPFARDERVVLAQGDIGEARTGPGPGKSLEAADLKRITTRRADEIQQVVPFFFINYLAFDCCVVRKRVFERIGGFDEKFMAAAENKLHLRYLGEGPIRQIGDVIEGAFEEQGPRLTAHPRIELEGFQALYENSTCEDMLAAAKQDPAWSGKPGESVLKDLISLGLEYPVPYPERVKCTHYDLDKARELSRFALARDPAKPLFWNDHALLDLRSRANRAMLHVSYADGMEGGKAGLLNWNLAILRLVRWLLSFTLLYSHRGRVSEMWTVGTRSATFGSLVRKVSIILLRSKTMVPDLYGETIW